MSKVKIDNLASEIAKVMKDYANATDDVVEKAVTQTSKEVVQELKQAHPSGAGDYSSWTEYNQGWKVMQTKTDKRYNKKATVHNATKYRLTHLLEKGHALVNGGRSRAFPHIAPVAEKAEDKLLEKIKKGIENA